MSDLKAVVSAIVALFVFVFVTVVSLGASLWFVRKVFGITLRRYC